MPSTSSFADSHGQSARLQQHRHLLKHFDFGIPAFCFCEPSVVLDFSTMTSERFYSATDTRERTAIVQTMCEPANDPPSKCLITIDDPSTGNATAKNLKQMIREKDDFKHQRNNRSKRYFSGQLGNAETADTTSERSWRASKKYIAIMPLARP